MKIASTVSLVVVSALVVGCAGAPKSPQQSDLSHVEAITEDCQLDLSRAMAITGDSDTVVMVEGSSGKGGGAAAGGAVSGGTALAIGTLSCVATGPIFFIPCLGIVLPGTTAAAAVGGAAYGAINSESADGVETKRNMLTEALRNPIASQRLVNLVEKKRLEAVAIVPPSMEKTLTITVPEWTLRIAMTELATVGSGPDTPYLLQASANLEVVRTGEVSPCFVKDFQALSPMKLSTEEWRAKEDEPVRSALDDMLATLATDISNDLMQIQLSLNRPLEDYKVSVEPMATGMKTEPVAVPTSEVNQSLSLIEKEASKPDQARLLDPMTGMNWVVVPSSPVDLSTANINCASLETGDKKKYRIPSLREFEEVWKRYKDDERLSVFKKREYIADSKNLFGSTAYPQTFSFASGNPGQTGQLRAAYSTCVSR